jgi:hypothetical protein
MRVLKGADMESQMQSKPELILGITGQEQENSNAGTCAACVYPPESPSQRLHRQTRLRLPLRDRDAVYEMTLRLSLLRTQQLV